MGRNGRSLAPGWLVRIIELILAVFDRFRLPGRGVRRRRVDHDHVLVRPVHFEYIAGLLRYLAIGTTGRLARVEGAAGAGRRDRVQRAGFRDFLRIGRATCVTPALRPERRHLHCILVDFLEGILAVCIGVLRKVLSLVV